MRYSKNPRENMLETGHIYKHPPGGSEVRQNVTFSFPKDERNFFLCF